MQKNLLTFACVLLSTPFYVGAQTPITQQTIQTAADGSTTITTTISAPKHQNTAVIVNDAYGASPAATATSSSIPAGYRLSSTTVDTPSVAASPNASTTNAEPVHFHFGSQKAQKSVIPSATSAQNPTTQAAVKYENVRQDPGDVMMQILNQRPAQ